MTFREKLKQEHPEKVGSEFIGGANKCPYNYGYESVGSSPYACNGEQCYSCWNREMPEPEQEIVPGAAPENLQRAISTAREWAKEHPEQVNDPVNHPAHYTAGGIECIDAIAAALTCQKDPMQAWLTGQVLKYLWRWPLKNGLEDLEKARFYLNRLIENLEVKKE